VGDFGSQSVLPEMNWKRSQLALLLLLLGCGSVAVGQTAAQKNKVTPFEPGEMLIYKAEVSRSLLKKIDVATLSFIVDRAPGTSKTNASGTKDQTPYSLVFTGDAYSEGFFTRLFNLKFHQHVESTVDAESLAVQKTVKLDEQGKRVRTSEADFDQAKGKVVWTERDPNEPSRPPRTVSDDFTGTIQDVVSAIYFLRTQRLEVGHSFQVPVSDSGRVYMVPVRVIEKKTMKTVLGRVSTLLIEPELFGERGMLNTKGQFFIWLTADDRRIPVSAQVKGDFGTFDITLRKLTRQTSQQALANR
jgi:Protein of unknown function (DUF3108)